MQKKVLKLFLCSQGNYFKLHFLNICISPLQVSCQHLDWSGFVSEESKESPRRFRTEQDRCQSGRTAYSYSSTVHQGTVPLHMQKVKHLH